MTTDQRGRAIAAAAAGIFLFAAMDALMKGASIAVGAWLAMLWRCVLGTAIGLAPWLATRPRMPGRAAMRLHLLRGGVTAVMAVCFFWGLARTPMAIGIALTFTAPLIALYLASLLLGERVPRAAWAGSALAFLGVAFMVALRWREASGADALGVVAIVLASFCYAYNIVLQRQQALAAAGPSEVALFQNLAMGLFLLLPAPFIGMAPPAGQWMQLAAAALMANISLQLLSWAYARAEAHALVPVEYSAFLWAALFGWLAFGEPLAPATVAGAALIVGGCAIALRRKAPRAPVEVGL